MQQSSGSGVKSKKIPVKESKKIPVKKSLSLKPKPFPVVGVGASAGGLEAFTKLLRHLDPNLGMAYVLVMHLSPNHKSQLTEILRTKTKMPVQTVKDGMEVMANNVYVIPPNTFMSLVDGHLKLAPRSLGSLGNYAVDYFFTGLAAIYKNNAIGVVLSGTASDGTLGLKAIKAEGGITFAQDHTAEFFGMPHHAYEAGYVDFMLPPRGIAMELARLGKVPYTVLPSEKVADHAKDHDNHPSELKKILSIVKNKSGVDFFLHYKQASVYRRVLRRMVLNKFDKLQDYCYMLKTNPREVDALYNDFLINVTKFFRDPEFYKALTKVVFPALIKQGKSTSPIRIWVAGCATGEEAYSMAISLIDFLDKKGRTMPIQIFASDLDANAIEKARLGIYPASTLEEVSSNHLKKFFKKLDGHYQIVKSVREICVFSQHNLLKDPPFSRMNLISCQNVLIYLETNPQKKVLQTFHYALKPYGYLFLGKSETIGKSHELFEHLNKKNRIYTRKQTKTPRLDFTIHAPASNSHKESGAEQNTDIEKTMDKLMLSRYVHPCVVVNKSLKIVQFFGATAPYLSPVVGKASLNVLKMIREDLAIDLMSLMQQARKTEKVTSKEGIRFYNKKVQQEVTIEVVPKKASGDIFFLVVFKETPVMAPLTNGNGTKSNGNSDQKSKTILKLENELIQSRGMIRSTNEEYETTYEELQANNEEILSSNEELQSVNEELEASKEELQSSNEELTTTNDELNKRNIELSESQAELKRVNEQLEQFAFISSHDLQEPLRKIQTFSGLLSSSEADLNDYAKKYSVRINVSAARMSALIKDLLSFSVLVKKKDHKSLAKVDLNETLKNVLDDFEVLIEEKKAVVNVSTLPAIPAVPVQMNQLFHNLLGNALKFSRGNPVINVSSWKVKREDYSAHPELRKGTNYAVISIQDNGIGFDQKFVSKMFMLFQRLNDYMDVGGTGVGLAICRKIVEDHNGFIFASGKENVGATFTVFLPAD